MARKGEDPEVSFIFHFLLPLICSASSLAPKGIKCPVTGEVSGSFPTYRGLGVYFLTHCEKYSWKWPCLQAHPCRTPAQCFSGVPTPGAAGSALLQPVVQAQFPPLPGQYKVYLQGARNSIGLNCPGPFTCTVQTHIVQGSAEGGNQRTLRADLSYTQNSNCTGSWYPHVQGPSVYRWGKLQLCM